jgi:hypothetical protein
VPEERRAEVLAKVKELEPASAGSSPTTSSELAVADLDAVVVGSGVNCSPARRCCARRWRVRVLEREDERTAELRAATCTTSSAPGIRSGSAARLAELGDELAARGSSTEHRLPDRHALPDGEAAFLLRSTRRTSPSWGRGRGAVESSSPPPTSPSACSARSCGRGTGLARLKSLRRLGRRGAVESPATCLSPAATGSPRPSPPNGRTACLRRVLHTGLGPDAAASSL